MADSIGKMQPSFSKYHLAIAVAANRIFSAELQFDGFLAPVFACL